MFTMVLQALGFLAFILGTIVLGTWLRIKPTKKNAEWTSRILHLIFWVGFVPPAALGVFHPGLSGYDGELGLPPLSRHTPLLVIGILGLLIGAYLILASNVSLWIFGMGANAFFLTQQLVVTNIYERIRNPMSLGMYLGFIGIGLRVGSTYLTLGTVLVGIPAHIFYLKYFEELELELRLGPPYLEYKQRVPFLLPRWGTPRK